MKDTYIIINNFKNEPDEFQNIITEKIQNIINIEIDRQDS